MRARLVILWLLLLGAAPAANAHSPESPPDKTLSSRYSRADTSWYIGFAFGAGGGWIRNDEVDETGGEAGASFTLIKVGWVPRPWLLVGLELSGWFHFDGSLWWSSTWVMTAHYDVMGTYFPWADRGYYAKLGMGLGLLSIENYHAFWDTTDQTTLRGFDLRAGLGHEWQLGSSFNLGAELATGLVLFDSGRTHDLSALLTFTWY